MRHVSHSHALSRDPAVSADGSARPHSAPRLDALRHRPRRLPAKAHDARRTGTRLRVDLPAAVLARLDLAPASQSRNMERPAGHPALPRHVVSLQTFEPLLAPADQTRPGKPRVETMGRDDALAARTLPQARRGTGCVYGLGRGAIGGCSRTGGFGGSLEPANHYSCRSAFIGSILEALRAGTYPARSAAPSKITTASARARRSTEFMPKRSDSTNRDVPNASGTLIAIDTAANTRIARSTIQTTTLRCAPSAMRIPISPVRRATV